MTREQDPPDSLAGFRDASREYAEAVEALKTIELQAGSIVGMGGGEELNRLIETFVQMARRARQRAAEQDLTDIAAWFDELADRAEAIQAAIVTE